MRHADPDICIVGHIPLDTIVSPSGCCYTTPGGMPFYASPLCIAFGMTIAVVTSTSDDVLQAKSLTSMLSAARIINFNSAGTTEFVNRYVGETSGADDRIQEVKRLARPIDADAILTCRASACLLGPLIENDIEEEAYVAARRYPLVAVDIQGLCRSLNGQIVVPRRSQLLDRVLPTVDIVKASRKEAEIATGFANPREAIQAILDAGSKEVLVTDGRAGSWVGTERSIVRINSVPARSTIDQTGCGDTFLSTYLLMRLGSCTPVESASAASFAAAAKVGLRGPLQHLPVELPNIEKWHRGGVGARPLGSAV